MKIDTKYYGEMDYTKDELVEIPPAILRMPLGNANLFCTILFIIVPMHTETGGINMNPLDLFSIMVETPGDDFVE